MVSSKLAAGLVALLGCVSLPVAHAAGCSAGLTTADLTEVVSESASLSDDFRKAFLSIPLDGQTATTQTVGATLVGSSMANEIAATAEGLRQLVTLRDRFVGHPAMSAVQAQLESAMREASARVRRVSMRYGSSAKMAGLQSVRDLAAEGMQFADGLATTWSCQ